MNPYKTHTFVKQNVLNMTKMKIKEAFLELYKIKNFQSITVKDICQKAYVARTTFYHYYKNIVEVIEEIEDEVINKLILINDDILNADIKDLKSMEFFEKTINYIDKNFNLFYLFLVKQPNIRFIDKWKKGIKYHFYDKCSKENCNINIELAIEMIASAAISGYTYWISNKDKVKRESSNEIICMFLTAIQNK